MIYYKYHEQKMRGLRQKTKKRQHRVSQYAAQQTLVQSQSAENQHHHWRQKKERIRVRQMPESGEGQESPLIPLPFMLFMLKALGRDLVHKFQL